MTLPTQTTIYGRVLPNQAKHLVSSRATKDFGFKYPILDDNGNYFVKSSGVELLKSNIRNLIKTFRGERFMLPDYGCNLRRYLMEPIDDVLFEEIKNDIQVSVTKYLSKVTLEKVQVFSNAENSIVNVKLFCSLKENKNSFVVDISV